MTKKEKYKNETADTEKDTCCLLSPGEKPIPNGLLPSRAHFRFGSQCKIHNNKLYLQPAKISYHFHTLLSLLQNLYPLKEGNITIGGLDLKHISNSSLRQMVGVVPQQIDLFSGTITNNIAVGDYVPDMQKILQLSKMLGIDEFVEQMPNTYNSIVSEQGVNLSGGQKQRLAIARALYRNPEILILDEATSSLDPASEQKVQDTLNWFKTQNKTVIIIAHRLSTIKNCDKILVLHKGKLIEQGTHNDLLKTNGHYKKLWNYHTAII